MSSVSRRRVVPAFARVSYPRATGSEKGACAALKSTAGADDSKPMLARLVPFAVSLVLAATASANPLIGVWKSDRDLTLLEMEKRATLTLEPRDVFSTPDLFGQAVAIYDDREVAFRFAEGNVPVEDMGFSEGFRRIDAPAAPAP